MINKICLGSLITVLIFLGLLQLYQPDLGAVLVCNSLVPMLGIAVLRKSPLSIIFFLNFINSSFLAFIFFSGASFSILSTSESPSEYLKVLLLDSIFWILIIFVLQSFTNHYRDPLKVTLDDQLLGKFFFLVSLVLLGWQLFEFDDFTAPKYIDVSNKGSVSLEYGGFCLAVGLYLTYRPAKSDSPRIFSFLSILSTVLITLLVVCTVLTGKRMALSYLLISFCLVLFECGYRCWSFLVISGSYLIGLLYGIFRDTLGFPNAHLLIEQLLNNSNIGAVLHSSSVYIKVVDQDLIAVSTRLISSFYNIFATLVVPHSLLPEFATGHIFIQNFYPIQGNGGLISAHFYYFWGYFGVFVAPLVIWIGMRFKSSPRRMILCFLIVLSPRWLLYNVGPVMRLIGFGILVLGFALICKSVFRKHEDIKRVRESLP